MITRHALLLSTVVILTAIVAGAASSQTSPAALPIRTPPKVKFLSPLAPRFIATPTESELCRQLQGRRCPPVLIYGGAAGGGLPTIDPAFKANLPNVRVSFVLQSI